MIAVNKKAGSLLLAGIVVAGSVAVYVLDFRQPALEPATAQIRKPAATTQLAMHFGQNRSPDSRMAAPITISQALAHSESGFELRPDKRFLIAVSIAATFPKLPDGLPGKKFQDGQWLISTDKGTLGDLPEYPDFPHAMRLLRNVAEKRLGTSEQTCTTQPLPEVAEKVTAFDDTSLISAMQTLNHEFHEESLSGTDLWLAAQAMTRLAYLDVDTTYTTDRLSAKAMALIALAEVTCGKDMPKEESLLAAHMGYTGAAERTAQKLPVSDPWRQYFNQSDRRLEKLAQQNPTSGEASYFWLRRLADLGLKKQWHSWYNQRYRSQIPSVYTLATLLSPSACDCTTEYVQNLPQQLLPAMQGSYSSTLDQDDLTIAPTRVIQDFDAAATHLRTVYKGPYLTADDLITYYRGYLYSGFYSWADYLLDEQDDIKGSQAYRDQLRAVPDEIGKEMYTWVNVKLAFKQAGVPLSEILRDMQSSYALSPDLYVDVMEIASARTNWGSPQARQAVRELTTLLDTRPVFRVDYGDELKYNLYLPEYEAADRSLAAQENPQAPSFVLWQDYFDADTGDLLRVAENASINRDARLVALAYLQGTKGIEQYVRGAYTDIIHRNPRYGYACNKYLKYLSYIKDYADTVRVARGCLASIPASDSVFDAEKTIVQLADAQLHLGRKEVAWKTISDVIYAPRQKNGRPGPYRREIVEYYAPVLAEGVKVSLARGDNETAEFLAKTLADRYPDDVNDQALLLRIMWQEGHNQDAAQFLMNLQVPLLYANWVTIVGKTFTEVFAHNPNAARTAFLALAHAKGNHNGIEGIGSGPLVFIANAVALYGNPGLAFELKQLIALPETPGMFPDQLADYEFLKSAKGESVAVRWLMRHTPSPTPQDLDRRIAMFYTENDMELLWSPITESNKAGDPNMLWLYRAASYVQHYPITKAQLTKLKDHFAKAGNSWHEYLGKYLLGQVSDEDIMNRKLDVQKFAEAIYYVALHQLSEHNYHEAEELLSSTLDRPSMGMWGFYSQNLLGYWENLQSLAVLEKKGVLFNSSN